MISTRGQLTQKWDIGHVQEEIADIITTADFSLLTNTVTQKNSYSQLSPQGTAGDYTVLKVVKKKKNWGEWKVSGKIIS